MCECPNGAAGKAALVAIFVISAEITTIFSFVYVLIFGLVAMVYNLMPLCREMEKHILMAGGFFAWLVAIGQIVTAAVMNEDMLQFCSEDSDFDMEDTTMCNMTLYRVMNSVGAILWILAGIIVCTIPDPRMEAIRPASRSVAPHDGNATTTASPDGKSITTKTTTMNPDGSMNVAETVERLDDCEV